MATVPVKQTLSPQRLVDVIKDEVRVSQRLPNPTEGEIMAPVPARQTAAVPPVESIDEKFKRLAALWHKAVAHHSSSRIRDNHPVYQEIIGMGPAVVPLLLRDLEVNRRHWFTALAIITGVDPIPKADTGNIPRMAEAWLRWGKENGYRW
jgi:hypothetical protein